MLKTLSYKMILLTLLLAVTLIAGMTLNGYASHPEPPKPPEYEAGPPIVGRLIFQLVSCVPDNCTVDIGGQGSLNVSVTFSGCCADCFATCKNSCNVKYAQPNSDNPNLINIPTYDDYPPAVYDTTGQLITPAGDGKLDLRDVTADYLKYYRLPVKGPKGCLSQRGGETLIIENVLNVVSTQNSLTADVILLYLLTPTQP